MDFTANKKAFMIKVYFANRDRAILKTIVCRGQAIIDMEAELTTGPDTPFFTFRSMYVQENNSDASRFKVASQTYGIMNWRKACGNTFVLFRRQFSKHNPSAPDITLQMR